MKRYLAILFFLTVHGAFEKSKAQSGDISSTSANGAASVASQQSSPHAGNIDLSTGQISPEINICSLDGIDLSTSVSFVYTGSAGIPLISPRGILDNLGKAWILNAGGYIKRTVRGIRDDKYFGQTVFDTDLSNSRGWLDIISGVQSSSANPGSTRPWYDGILWLAQGQSVGQMVLNDFNYNTTLPSTITSEEFANGRYWFYGGIMHACDQREFDSQPDLFEYNLNGITGSFVFDENGSVVLLNDNDIQVEVPDLSVVSGGSWIFTTTDGTKYFFENTDDFREFGETTFTSNSFDDPNTTEQDEKLSQTKYISKWCLTEIHSLYGDKIKFTYANGASIGVSKYVRIKEDYSPGNIPVSDPTGYSDPGLSEDMQSISSAETNIHALKGISSCKGSISFKYNSQMTALIEIDKWNYKGELQLKFLIPDVFPKRTLIQKAVNGNSPDRVYSFEYFPSVNVASMDDSHFADWWGFVNSNSWHEPYSSYSGTLISGNPFSLTGGNRTPDLNLTLSGVLKKIIFPEGGNTEYQYELNDYWSSTLSLNIPVGGLRIKKVIQSDGVNQALNIETNYSYKKFNSSTQSSGEVDETTSNSFNEVNAMYVLRRFQGGPNGNLGDLVYYKYFLRRSSAPALSHSVDMVRYSCVSISNPGKGKVVKQFTSFTDRPDDQPDLFSFNYGFANDISSYIAVPSIVYGMKNDNSAERGLLKSTSYFNEQGIQLRQTSYEYDFHPSTYTEKSVVGLNIVSHNYFSTVENPDGITSSPCGEQIEMAKNYQLEYCKNKSRWIYLKKIINEERNLTGTNVLTSSDEFYYEGNHKKASKIVATNSDGGIIKKYNLYTLDFSLTGISPSDAMTNSLEEMNNLHMNLPISQINTKTVSGVESIIDAEFTKYKLQTGIPVPEVSYYLAGNSNLAMNSIFYPTVTSAGLFSFDSRYKQTTQFLSYDQNYQCVETKNNYDVVNSLLIDPITQNPIGSVANASVTGNECDYLSFEGPSSTFNSFSLTDVNSHTGEYSNKVLPNPATGSNDLSYSLTKSYFPSNHNQKYRISAWVKTEAGFGSGSSGGALTVQAITIANVHISTTNSLVQSVISDTQGKWKFYECIVDLSLIKSQTTPVTLSTTPIGFKVYVVNYNNGKYLLVDDIRIQPFEASQMTTQTLTGLLDQKSSEMDATGNSMTSEYDGFGRTILTRDKNQNILKKVDYNDRKIFIDPEFACDPWQGIVGEPIQFSANGYSNSYSLTYSWVFGDGSSNTSNTQTPSHTYSTPGIYPVVLTVNDGHGTVVSTGAMNLKVNATPITCDMDGPLSLDYFHPPALPPLAIGNYSIQNLSGGSGIVASYHWTVERANNLGVILFISSNPSITFTFASGEYIVSCLITDTWGGVGGVVNHINVTYHPY